MEPPLGRADRDAKRTGDLPDWSLLDVVQGQDHAVLGAQSVERAADGVAVGDAIDLDMGGRVGPVVAGFDLRPIDPDLTNLDLPEADAMSPRHSRRVGDDPIQPAIEGGGVTQPGKLPPRGHQGFLRRIGRVRGVAQDRPSQAITAINSGRDQGIERRGVTRSGTSDEALIIRRCRDAVSRGQRVQQESPLGSRTSVVLPVQMPVDGIRFAPNRAAFGGISLQ